MADARVSCRREASCGAVRCVGGHVPALHCLVPLERDCRAIVSSPRALRGMRTLSVPCPVGYWTDGGLWEPG